MERSGDNVHDEAPAPERPLQAPVPRTDAERYQWIRGNRGNSVILEALRAAQFDADFDRHIDAAIQAQHDGVAVERIALGGRPFGRRRSDFEQVVAARSDGVLTASALQLPDANGNPTTSA